jgi:hypothetical protein
MKFSFAKKLLLVVAAALVCAIPSAFADTTAYMYMTSAGNNVMDGIYVGPYTANITPTGGVTQNNVSIICDDFSDESYVNSGWTATVHSFTAQGLSQSAWATLFPQNYVTLYEEAAWLAIQMLQQPSGSQGIYSYAVWAIFNPTGVQQWLKNDPQTWAAVQSLIKTVQGMAGNFSLSQFANVLIYTPKCSNGAAGSCQSQEFFVVQTPEGGTALAYLLLAGLSCMLAMRFRVRRGHVA